ncbi:winged helix-turn-helix transcriptional regulator [Viridibacillus sp. YIM B01967]|uniref:Winged helix-turn-helix transcriptional regulator n=1 Tax=Viridibacillus soli TaxID=2798301 RepID=A0ABS1HD26_9BACL|nr:metalloregulator ArsR/SmtB family transcription factor [Viridibacillus soli]MBK3496878.1 winged helix-turn-helix transcriptional regulator [Viridibacillus soli]
MGSLTQMEKQLKAISDANRLKLLACLKRGEVCVCDLVDVLQVSQPAVSQQLRKLKEAGIILERKKGTWKHYRLNEKQSPYIQAVLDALEPITLQQCGSTCTSNEGDN